MIRKTFLVVFSLLINSSLSWTPSGSILNVPQEIDIESRISPDPDNCNVYYFLKVPMTCGEGNAFNKASLRCDSIDNVAKVDPECGGEAGDSGGQRGDGAVVIAGRSRGGGGGGGPSSGGRS